jgi:hypothetical protein
MADLFRLADEQEAWRARPQHSRESNLASLRSELLKQESGHELVVKSRFSLVLAHVLPLGPAAGALAVVCTTILLVMLGEYHISI